MTKTLIDKGERTVEIEAAVPKDYTITFWYERDLEEMPDSEREHVKELLEQGYTSGQLLYDEYGDGNINNGWWEVLAPEEG